MEVWWRTVCECNLKIINDQGKKGELEVEKPSGRWRDQGIKVNMSRCGTHAPPGVTHWERHWQCQTWVWSWGHGRATQTVRLSAENWQGHEKQKINSNCSRLRTLKRTTTKCCMNSQVGFWTSSAKDIGGMAHNMSAMPVDCGDTTEPESISWFGGLCAGLVESVFVLRKYAMGC